MRQHQVITCIKIARIFCLPLSPQTSKVPFSWPMRSAFWVHSVSEVTRKGIVQSAFLPRLRMDFKQKQEGSRLDFTHFVPWVGREGILENVVGPFPEAFRHQQVPEKSAVLQGGQQGTGSPCEPFGGFAGRACQPLHVGSLGSWGRGMGVPGGFWPPPFY